MSSLFWDAIGWPRSAPEVIRLRGGGWVAPAVARARRPGCGQRATAGTTTVTAADAFPVPAADVAVTVNRYWCLASTG